MKRIAIDMDDVIADTLSALLKTYNTEFDKLLTKDAIQGFEIAEALPLDQRERIDAYLLAEGFFRNLEVMPGSQAVIAALAKHYEIFIATAAMDVPWSFVAKYEWLKEHFPSIPDSHIVFCGDKSVINTDYLIDDRPRNFERFVGQGILFSAPHNQAETRYPRVHCWEDVARLLL